MCKKLLTLIIFYFSYSNFYHYLKDNFHSLEMTDELLELFRSNIRYTSREKFQDLHKRYPQFTKVYADYLKSVEFRKLVYSVKKKYDHEYQKLFFRHSLNFLNFYLKEKDPYDKIRQKKRRGIRKSNKSIIQ